MLKLSYTDMGLHMEKTAATLEQLIAQRVRLAISIGQTLHVEATTASFLLSIHHSHVDLELTARDRRSGIDISFVDRDFLEIVLQGSWLAETQQAHEGTFLTLLGDSLSETLRDRSESLIYNLWQLSESQVSLA